MDATLEDLLNAVEHHANAFKDSKYQELLITLQKTHDKTAEGLAAQKREKERQIREDERVARELAEQLLQQGQLQQTPLAQAQIMGSLLPPTTVGNIMYNAPPGINYQADILYHRVRSDGIDTVRNPDTGIFVMIDGTRGIAILDKYGYDYPEFIEMMPNEEEEEEEE